MPAVSPELSATRIKGAMTNFMEAMRRRSNQGQPAKIKKLMATVPSENNTRTETFIVLEDMPNFNRWDDGQAREFGDFGSYSQSFPITRFQLSLQWERQDDEDSLVKITKFLTDAGDKYPLLKTNIFFQILSGSANPRLLKNIPNCLDGLPLFSAARTLFGSKGNIVSGSGVTSAAKIQRDLNQGVLRLQGLRDTHGNLYHSEDIRDNGLLIVGPSELRESFDKAFNVEYHGDGNGATEQNYVKTSYGKISLLTSSRLSGNDWYVFADGLEDMQKPIFEIPRTDLGGLEVRYWDETNSREMSMNSKREFHATVKVGFGCSNNFAGVKVSNS